MPTANPLTLAGWTLGAGWTPIEAPTAIAVAMAAGADPTAAKGAWGIGGPAGDGPGQARTALVARQSTGWGAFPAYSSARRVLMMPVAAAAAAEAQAAGAIRNIPNPVSTAIGGVENIAGAVGQVGTVAGNLVSPAFWLRGVKVFVGLAMVSLGTMALVNVELTTRIWNKYGGVITGASGTALNVVRTRRELGWFPKSSGAGPPSAPAPVSAAPASPAPPPPPPKPARSTYRPRHMQTHTAATERTRASVSKNREQPPGRRRKATP